MFSGEQGVIRNIDNSKMAIVFEQGDACDACGLKVVCSPGKESERMLTLPKQVGFTVGQHVQIDEKLDLELRLALIQFGLPLLAFILGLFPGYFYPIPGLAPELSGFIVACLLVAGSFFIARRMVKRLSESVFEKFLSVRPV